MVDVSVPFGRRIFVVIVLWFDEYVHGCLFVDRVSERACTLEQYVVFGGEGVPGGR